MSTTRDCFPWKRLNAVADAVWGNTSASDEGTAGSRSRGKAEAVRRGNGGVLRGAGGTPQPSCGSRRGVPAATLAAGGSWMQSAELYSHPLRVLDVEARLGAPPVLQTALWSAGSPRLRYFRADSGWQRSAASRQVAARAPRGAMRPLRRQVQTICLRVRRAACGIAATGGFDFLKCQTFAASPAEPGELLFWFSIPL